MRKQGISQPADPSRARRTASPKPLHPAAEATTLLRSMYDRMVEAYGPQQWWPAESAVEIMVGAYLTQNTSWRGVERSIAHLREHHLLHLHTLYAIGDEELRIHIRPSGYMVRKAAAIKAFVRLVVEEYAGSLDRLAAQPTALLRAQLLALPGVGQETADALLLYALGHPVMVVDEYLRRVVIRHGLAPEAATYNDLQRLALGGFADERSPSLPAHFNEFHALIVMVGKSHCGPRPKCAGCPLAAFPALLHPTDNASSTPPRRLASTHSKR